MKKVYKNNKGFTLVEMVIVVAIILLFSIVFYFSVSSYLNRAKSAKDAISTHNEQVSVANDEVNTALND